MPWAEHEEEEVPAEGAAVPSMTWKGEAEDGMDAEDEAAAARGTDRPRPIPPTVELVVAPRGA